MLCKKHTDALNNSLNLIAGNNGVGCETFNNNKNKIPCDGNDSIINFTNQNLDEYNLNVKQDNNNINGGVLHINIETPTSIASTTQTNQENANMVENNVLQKISTPSTSSEMDRNQSQSQSCPTNDSVNSLVSENGFTTILNNENEMYTSFSDSNTDRPMDTTSNIVFMKQNLEYNNNKSPHDLDSSYSLPLEQTEITEENMTLDEGKYRDLSNGDLVSTYVPLANQICQKDTTFTKIFVGGLPYHTTDDSLRKFFEVFGEIEEAVVITDRQTGKSRGYGFVTMSEQLAAERATLEPNPIIDGRKANVNLAYIGAKPRTNGQITNPLILNNLLSNGGPGTGVTGSPFNLNLPLGTVYALPNGTAISPTVLYNPLTNQLIATNTNPYINGSTYSPAITAVNQNLGCIPQNGGNCSPVTPTAQNTVIASQPYLLPIECLSSLNGINFMQTGGGNGLDMAGPTIINLGPLEVDSSGNYQATPIYYNGVNGCTPTLLAGSLLNGANNMTYLTTPQNNLNNMNNTTILYNGSQENNLTNYNQYIYQNASIAGHNGCNISETNLYNNSSSICNNIGTSDQIHQVKLSHHTCSVTSNSNLENCIISNQQPPSQPIAGYIGIPNYNNGTTNNGTLRSGGPAYY